MINKTGLLLIAFLLLAKISIARQPDQKAPEASNEEKELSFGKLPNLKAAFIDTTPANRNDGISVGNLSASANKEMILELAKEIADNQHGVYDGLLILHRNKLVFESYYNRGRVDLPHFQASATKAYTSLVLGRAMQLGYLTMDDLNKPVISFLKELDPSKFVEGADEITLHKALTMRGGLNISKEDKEKFKNNPDMLKGQGLVQSLLEHSEPITKLSQVYYYGNYNPRLTMQVINAVVPGTAQDFIKTELLDKLGITNYVWNDEVSGLPEAGWNVTMTARDMAKLGMLALNNGKWNGEQLIPEAYVTKAIHRIVRHSYDDNFDDDGRVTNTGYGYYWWVSDLESHGKKYFSTSAIGGGGQYVSLIKELDLIIVATAHDRRYQTLNMTADRIIPAFINKD
ncbi:MAG: serine hydrolase [Bacteroidota bacterium]